MDFGSVVRQKREELQLDLRAFAARTGVDATTISRIENSRAQVTLGTAVRICESVGISLSDLWYALTTKQSPDLLPREPLESVVIPVKADADMLIARFRRERHACELFLARVLNRMALLSHQTKQMNGNSKALRFVPEDITQLLLDAPFYRFELQYPADLQASAIWDIYRNGGVLILADIGATLKSVRRQQQLTLARLEDSVKISTSVLSHLETGTIERIRLVDVLAIESQLELEGRLLAMYWSVSKFHHDFVHWAHSNRAEKEQQSLSNGLEYELKVITLFTTMCRWLQVLSWQENSWIQEIRAELHQ